MCGDLRQSKEWARYLSSQGWQVEKLQIADYRLQVYVRKIPLIGSVVKIQRPRIIPPVEAIDKIARKHRALFVKLEPLPTVSYKLLTRHGFIRDSAPSLPTKTTVLPLTKSEDKLWKALSQDTRHDTKEAEKYQTSVISYQSGDRKFGRALESFSHLLSETGRRGGFWPPNFGQLKAKAEAFGKNAVLFLAYPKPYPPNLKPLAGALILIHGTTAYYHHTATSTTGRRLNASYFLMWRIIQNAKSSGLKALDLGSIYDPRYHKATKRWQNFSIFKKKWGGKEVEYPPPLIKYYSSLAKLLF